MTAKRTEKTEASGLFDPTAEKRILRLFEIGRLAEAEAEARVALAANPPLHGQHHGVVHLLGVLLLQKGDLQGAEVQLREAIRLRPQEAAYQANLGCVLTGSGRAEEAVRVLTATTKRAPDLAEAHLNLAVAENTLGRHAAAERSARKAIELSPDMAEAFMAFGTAKLGLLDYPSAVAALRRAIERKPDDPEAHSNLAVGLRRMGKLGEARDAARRAIELRPSYAEALCNLGSIEASLGDHDAAMLRFGEALAIDPGLTVAEWGRCMAELRPVYASEGEMQASRIRYGEALARLSGRLTHGGRSALGSMAHVVGLVQPFFLPYQGENDRELQSLHGRLACRMMEAAYPAYSKPVPPRSAKGRRVRVGVLSGFFRAHSNWKIPIKGWVEQLDKGRFELFGYHTGEHRDEETGRAKQSFVTFHEGMLPTEAWAERISRDALDVLLLPEIGMDPTTMRLAALRLAPVQCTSWGHPNTTGLPTLDYFLSSDLMEPPGAEALYTEKLVRLPNLSIYFQPVLPPTVEKTRADFGLAEGDIVYWCCQSLPKYLPRYDHLFARIAADVPRSRFVFIENGIDATKAFQSRMARAFSAHGLKTSAHCTFLPTLDRASFDAVSRLSDVFLDSIGWSGCNSTFEAMERNLPVVTLPGATMRSRHTAAICSMMDLPECIASSEDDYVRKAVALGNDQGLRLALRAKVAAHKEHAYRDRRPVVALEEFLLRVTSP